MSYIVEERYEYYGMFGKNWTRWCKQIAKYNTKEEAEQVIKNMPKVINKLKLEYRVCQQG